MVAPFSVVTRIVNSCGLSRKLIWCKIDILAVLSALLCYGGKTGVCCTDQDVDCLQGMKLMETTVYKNILLNP